MDYVRTRVDLQEHRVLNAQSTDFPGNYVGYNDAWDFEKFKNNFEINFISSENNVLEFDMVGIDVAFANAFRRILIAEVPSMAIEKVFMNNNTSIVADEVLAHRLGLIPFKADARLFEFKEPDELEVKLQSITLEFQLKVRCSKRPHPPEDATSHDDLYLHHSVFSGDLKWIPIGNQKALFKEEDIGPLYKDILLAKLRPGHEIDLKVHCVKGVGQDHGKFTPVAPASYRLHPEIILKKPIMDEDAFRLQKCFSEGVIGIEETKDGKKAKVLNSRLDTCSRNVFRHEDLKNSVAIRKIRDHIIFKIESEVGLSPEILFCESIGILKNKCKVFLDELNFEKK